MTSYVILGMLAVPEWSACELTRSCAAAWTIACAPPKASGTASPKRLVRLGLANPESSA